jgi:surfeit locus 1 family protein
MTPDIAGTRRGVLVPTLAALVAFAILVSLGVWQIERKTLKERLIANLEARLAAAPVALPSPKDWSRLTPDDDEFLRVTFSAQLENDKEGLVYTTGSSLRSDTSGPGYWVFTPARLTDGNFVMVNRGFVPEGLQKPAKRPDGQIAGPVTMVGVLRWPEKPGLFTPAEELPFNLWFSRDSTAIAAAKGITAAPFYVELESPEPPGALPRVGHLKPNLPNNHLQYVVTWFGLAVVLVGVYVAWLFGNWRREPAR